jgi:hypothetical protein
MHACTHEKNGYNMQGCEVAKEAPNCRIDHKEIHGMICKSSTNNSYCFQQAALTNFLTAEGCILRLTSTALLWPDKK